MNVLKIQFLKQLMALHHESRRTYFYSVISPIIFETFSFKIKTKTWKCETCVCRLCQTYQQNLFNFFIIYFLLLHLKYLFLDFN